MDKIVVGIDGSENSLAALRWALDLAERAVVPLHAVTVWEQPVNYGAVPPVGAPAMTYGAMSTEPDEEVRNALRDEARQTLAEALRACGAEGRSVEVRTSDVEGHAGPVLTEMAREGDLLVVGRSGHGALVGMLLGSVAQHVAGHSACPVVTVPGAGSAGTS